MSNDLVKRLRETADKRRKGNRFDSIEYEAADYIEELKVALDGARDAIGQYAEFASKMFDRVQKAEAEIKRLQVALDACTSGTYTTMEKTHIARIALDKGDE